MLVKSYHTFAPALPLDGQAVSNRLERLGSSNFFQIIASTYDGI